MYAATLYRKAFAILRNKEDAQDALQDGWVRAYSNIHSFEGRSSFSTWLTQIVINCALMILRRNRNRREVSTDEAGETSFIHEIPDRSLNPEQTLQSERKAILNETIGGLRPRIRMTVEFGPMQGRSPKEAAPRLGISAQAAKGRLFHARAALRKSAALRAVAQATSQACRVGSLALRRSIARQMEGNETD
jgi:RNA polymerase sigma-70 factor (ECF subfamily)